MTAQPISLSTGSDQVPLFNAAREAMSLKQDLLEAMERVLESGSYILGPEVKAFEEEVADYLGTTSAVGVASGTDAIWLALKAVGVRAGDAVLTTPFTFFATTSAILNAGAIPVFADIEPTTFCLDPSSVRDVVEGNSRIWNRLGLTSASIKAIVAVHIFGQAADMDGLRAVAEDYSLPVVEDAAQAMGARYRTAKAGSMGAAGCFSFFPTKNLGGFGDGGLVATSDAAIAERLRLLRSHGSSTKYRHQVVGTNSRLDALQAALLRIKLHSLDSSIEARQKRARRYDRDLSGLEDLLTPAVGDDRTHTYHQYVVRAKGQRDRLRELLHHGGVQTAIHYPVPVHLQPAVASMGYAAGDLPVTERACAEVMSLPMSPVLSDAEQELVIHRVCAAVSERLR